MSETTQEQGRMQFCSKCQKLYPTEMQFCPIDGKPLEPRYDFAPGMVLRQKYEILEEIGSGGMGRVFRVKDLDFAYGRNQSALKIPAAHLASDPGFIQRFRDEAAKARVLNHPNVVRVEHIDRTESGVPFLVMELVEGHSLRWWMERPTRMDWRGAVNIAREIALALDAAHTAGLAHCDIKPENVLSVTKDAPLPLKVTDFGLAKATDVLIARMTTVQRATSWGAGLVVGTPEYMSPEQARGREMVGPPSDVYSLGAVLFEMLTGNAPYGKIESAEGARRAHEERAPGSLRGRGDLPSGLTDLVEEMLDRSPEDRPTATEVEGRLSRMLKRVESAPKNDLGTILEVDRKAAVEITSTATIENGSQASSDRDVEPPEADEHDQMLLSSRHYEALAQYELSKLNPPNEEAAKSFRAGYGKSIGLILLFFAIYFGIAYLVWAISK